MMDSSGKSGINQDNENSEEENEVWGARRRRLLCELLQDFAQNSTLHGLRYLTARGLSALERIFWGIIFLASVCLCVFATTKVWVKWQTSPIIISVNEQLTSVSEVPFPAVTICPMTKVIQNYYNFTKHYITYKKFIKELENENVSLKEKQNRTKDFIDHTPYMRELVNLFNLVCYIDDNDFGTYNRVYLDHSSVMHLLKAAPSFKDFFIYGEWLQKSMGHDSDYFAPVLMRDGLCFTFNTLAANEMFHLQRIHTNYSYLNASTPQRGWSPESQYYRSSPDTHTYPRRGRSKSGLYSLILGEDVNSDICQGMFSGYKVYLHNPADMPQSSSNFYAVQSGEYALFSVKANLVSTSDTLMNYMPHIRQCYFPSERTLHYFKVYTQSNCQMECLTNYTLARCGCVKFYMPRSNSTSMCVSGKESTCLYLASVKYSATDGNGNSNESLCQCLPLCHNVQYESDVTIVRTRKDEAHSKTWRLVKNEINNESKPVEKGTRTYVRIDMHFKDAQFTSLRRSELFGATDFLANCGGLLGLFLGFSFLSLVELFFFATLRMACMFTSNDRAAKREKADFNTSKLSKF